MTRTIRGNVVKAVLVTLLLVFTLFPVYWMISSAFDKKASSGGQSRSGPGSSSAPPLPALPNFGTTNVGALGVTRQFTLNNLNARGQ